MKELRFTLYDILGYLFPGGLTLLVLLIVVWGRSWHHFSLDAIARLSATEMGLFLLLSYFLGHALQALGALCEDKVLIRIGNIPIDYSFWFSLSRRNRTVDAVIDFCGVEQHEEILACFSADVQSKFYDAFRRRFGLEVKNLNRKEVYKLCDAALAEKCPGEEREIHYCREGFYRGTFISSILVLIAWPFIGRGVEIVLQSRTFHTSGWHISLAWALFSICVGLSFHRYKKFRRLRITNCFERFIASMTSQELKSSDQPTPPLAMAKSA